MTRMQQTSLYSYYKIMDEGSLGRRQQEVLDVFRQSGEMTNLQASIRLSIPINQVTPRVKELRDYGLLEKKGSVMQNNDRPALLWGVVR